MNINLFLICVTIAVLLNAICIFACLYFLISPVSIFEYFHPNLVNLPMDPRIYDNLFPFRLCLAPTWPDLFAYLNLNGDSNLFDFLKYHYQCLYMMLYRNYRRLPIPLRYVFQNVSAPFCPVWFWLTVLIRMNLPIYKIDPIFVIEMCSYIYFSV